MVKTPSFTEYPKGSETREMIVTEDKLIEEILRKLGFKPGDIFKLEDLREKARVFYKIASKEEISKFSQGLKCEDEEDFATLVTDLSNSDVVEKYCRFISESELRDLKELRGENVGAKSKQRRSPTPC